MIRYSLECKKGHGFEGWFSSSADYDLQKERGLVECPACGSRDVSKSLMAPSVATARKKEERREVAAKQQAALQPGGLDPQKREMLKQLKELRDKVLSGAENVGEKFAEEARKIHYGEADARGIFGQASIEDAKALVEEGIDVLPIPDLPEDRN
jgi:hypothetical protein